MMMKALVQAAAMAVAVVVAGAASAATVAGSWNLTQYQTGDPGLVVQVSQTSGSFSQPLGVGDHAIVNLFKIWTNEGSVNSDDTVAKPIKVAFNFTAPPGMGDVSGQTSGVLFLGGLFQWGKVEWNGPLTLPYVTVRLFDEKFNEGAFGLGKHGAQIKAKITYTGEPAPIPLPPAALLLIGALGGLGFVSRRKRPA